MHVNNIIKAIYLLLASGFQLYLAYASTLYLEIGSFAFALVVLTATTSVAVIGYYILVKYEQENPKDFKSTAYQNTRTTRK